MVQCLGCFHRIWTAKRVKLDLFEALLCNLSQASLFLVLILGTITACASNAEMSSGDISKASTNLPEINDAIFGASNSIIHGIDLEGVLEAPLTSGPGVYWNSWFQEAGSMNGVVSSVLEVGRDYTIVLDISPYRYADAGIEGENPSDDFIKDINKTLQNPKTDSLTVYVKPVTVGRGLRFLAGEEQLKRFDIDLRRIKTPGIPRDQEEGLSDFSTRVQAGKIKIDFRALEEGCAAVAFSIWNRNLERPIDDYIHTVAIHKPGTPIPKCKISAHRARKISSSNLPLLFEKPDGVADAAIHLFEMKLGENTSRVAVFGEAGKTMAWSVGSSFSWILGNSNFLSILDNARSSGDYSMVGDFISRALFSAESDEGRSHAQEAKQRLIEIAKTKKRPILFARLVDLTGRSIFLPIGAARIGSRFLGDSYTIVQPLPQQTYRHRPMCIGDRWTLAFPTTLEGVGSASYEAFLRELDRSNPGRLSAIKDLREYWSKQGAESTPEGLILLAHHGDGLLWYDAHTDVVMSDEIVRKYGKGSIAVIGACRGGDLLSSEKRLALFSRLNSNGIDALVLSPFDVPADLGIGMATHFYSQLSIYVRNPSRRAEPVTLGELFEKAIEALEKDPAFQNIKAKPRYEFTLAGNSFIQFCNALGTNP